MPVQNSAVSRRDPQGNDSPKAAPTPTPTPTSTPASPTVRTTLDQQRAAYAWQHVQGCSKEYVNLAKAAPALIMNNGLMQTLAFYESKGKPQHRQLANHLNGWLHQQNYVAASDFNAVMTRLQASESLRYRQATEEALALLRWIRQFTAAVNGG